MSTAHNESVGAVGAKLAPALTVGGASFLGLDLQDWVLILTGLYATLQIGFLLYDRLIKPRKEKRNGRK